MKPSQGIFLSSLLLTAFGVLMIGNISTVTAYVDFNDPWYYTKLQFGWSLVGLVVMLVLSRIDYRIWEKYARIALLGTFLLLVLVIIPGLGTQILGARRWLNLGIFSFQPAELAKLSMAIYYSSVFKARPRFAIFAFTLTIIGFLIMLQPDLGTFIILAGMGLCVYVVSGGQLTKLLWGLPVAGIVLLILILIAPYRLERLKTFIDPESDPQGRGYQIRQVLLSLGSGGVWGVGLGQSRQKYDYIPEVATDSIFAVIAEELGYVGGIAIIGLYMSYINFGLRAAQLNKDVFGRNLSMGLTSIIGIQAFINLSSITALFPFTGVPLAFISYGGSSLVVMLAVSGILINIAKHAET